MELRIEELPVTRENLESYAPVPIAFTATSILRLALIDGGLGGVTLTEQSLPAPVHFDGDAVAGEGPLRWLDHGWDLSGWVMLCAFDGERRVGGAVVAVHTDGMWFLRGRTDMSALWDIRIDPDYRRQGVGRALIEAATSWSKSRRFAWMKIETQNTNVAACRFYHAMGARLGGLERYAYGNLPDEVELDWYLGLSSPLWGELRTALVAEPRDAGVHGLAFGTRRLTRWLAWRLLIACQRIDHHA